MVELNYVNSDEISDFKNGADIRLSVLFNTLNTSVPNDTIAMTNELFKNSVTHNNLVEVHGLLTESMSVYNREAIATVFDKLVAYDNQTYYDIICIIRSIIEMKDNNERVSFCDKILNIREYETYDNASDYVNTSGEDYNEDTYPEEE